MFELEESPHVGANIKVIGVGGGGGNAVQTMIEGDLGGVDFIVANTDQQALEGHPSDVQIPLGNQLTKGLGAGANPDVGRKAAVESHTEIEKALKGSDMVLSLPEWEGARAQVEPRLWLKLPRTLGFSPLVWSLVPLFLKERRERFRPIAGFRS